MSNRYLASVIEEDNENISPKKEEQGRQFLFLYCQEKLEEFGKVFEDPELGKWVEDRLLGEENEVVSALNECKDEAGKIVWVFLKNRFDKKKKPEDAVAIIAVEGDMPRVWKELEVLELNVPIVKRPDWEVYAYPHGMGNNQEQKKKGSLRKKKKKSIVEKVNNRPEYLLVFDSIRCEDFFNLDWDKVAGKLMVLKKLPKDHPSLKRWLWMNEIRKIGKEKLLLKYPDLKTIELE